MGLRGLFITLIALLKAETQGGKPWLSSSAHDSHFSWMQVDKQCSFLCVRAPVINVWVTTPLGVLNNPFTGDTYQISRVSGTYITIYNIMKITVMKW